MAEDHSQRYRSNETIARTGQPRGAAPSSGAANDPLAELARLIGQTDPFSDAPARRTEPAPAAAEWSAPSPQPHAHQSFAPADFHAAPQAPGHGPGEPYYAQQTWTQPLEEPAQVEGHYPAEQEIPAYLTGRGAAPSLQAQEGYAPSDDHFEPEHEDYYDEPPPRRRMAVLAVAAVFGLAVLGTAGAFGYRTLFGSGSRVPPVIQADKSPLKVVPDAPAAQGGKTIADRVTSPGEKVVSREEKPVDITQLVQASAPPQASAGNGVVGGEPKKVQTIVIRPDGSSSQPVAMPSPMPPEAAAPQAAPPLAPATPARPKADSGARVAQAAAPQQEPPLSLSPDQAPSSRPVRTANAAPAAAAASPAAQSHVTAYAVQIASQKTEADAKAAYQAIAKKYPQVLEGKSMFVYSVDLGAKGTYYRAMVGPYSVASEASEVCSALKSAGGSCLIQRNP
jgi:hypothetical protein